jgi:hypothetical protein
MGETVTVGTEPGSPRFVIVAIEAAPVDIMPANPDLVEAAVSAD